MTSCYFAPDFKVTVDGTKLAADVSKNVMSLSVTSQLDVPDRFDLTLANPYPEMRWTHGDEAELFKEGAAVKIELGYVDALQPIFDGEITRIGPTFPAGGTPTLTLGGESRLHRLRGSARTRTFQDVTDRQIAETIAQDLGFTAECEETGTIHPYVVQYNQMDLTFLRQQAQRIRFEVLVEGRKLIFRRAREQEEKVCTLVWGHPRESFAPGSQVVPLESFQPTMRTRGQVNGVEVRGYDPGSKEPIVGRAGSGDEESTLGAGESGSDMAAAAFGRREEAQVATPVASQEEADQRARAMYNQRLSGFVEGSASTFGVPDLRAGRKVEIRGIGPRFSGEYYVTSSTHTLSDGGYRTRIYVRKGGSG